MEEKTGFSMKNNLILPSIANKHLNTLRDDKDEPICTYNDECMRHFVRQPVQGGRCSDLSQYYKLTISDEVFNNISKEFYNNGNKCEILDLD